MTFLFGKKYTSHRTFLFLFAVMLGLLVSRALISIATIALFINVLIDGDYPKTLQNFFRRKHISILALLLFIVVLGIGWTEDIHSWLRVFVQNLPFLVFPLAIIHWKNKKPTLVQHLLAAFTILITASGLAVLFNFIANYELYTTSIQQAQAIPTPHNHIRYSLLLALSTLTSLHLFVKKHHFFKVREKWIWLIISIFTFILLHILSIRSGLATLYIALSFYAAHYIWKNRQWKLGIGLTIILCASPFVAYKSFPSLQHKMSYMRYDIEQFRKGEIGENSDANRLRSLQVGWAIAKENVWTGVGVGNVKNAVNTYYNIHNPTVKDINRKLPHNQFLWTFVEHGIFGLGTLLFVVFYPLFKVSWRNNPLYICFWLIFITSFLVEATLEIQIGISAFALFSSLLLLNPSHE